MKPGQLEYLIGKMYYWNANKSLKFFVCELLCNVTNIWILHKVSKILLDNQIFLNSKLYPIFIYLAFVNTLSEKS